MKGCAYSQGMNNGRHGFSTLNRRESGKDNAMSVFAFLSRNSDGEWAVQSMGDAPVFGGAQCGATFSLRSAAVAFLRANGFDPHASGAWIKGAETPLCECGADAMHDMGASGAMCADCYRDDVQWENIP